MSLYETRTYKNYISITVALRYEFVSYGAEFDIECDDGTAIAITSITRFAVTHNLCSRRPCDQRYPGRDPLDSASLMLVLKKLFI